MIQVIMNLKKMNDDYYSDNENYEKNLNIYITKVYGYEMNDYSRKRRIGDLLKKCDEYNLNFHNRNYKIKI